MLHELHPPDEKLLMSVDGELSPQARAQVEAHLASCWACRSRKQELETTIGSFVRLYRDGFSDSLSSPEGPRALLVARMRQAEESDRGRRWFLRFPHLRLAPIIVLSTLAIAAAAALMWHSWTNPTAAEVIALKVPNHAFTPGATIALDRRQVCQQTRPNNRTVDSALRREVFAEYGIAVAHVDAYEVDYLITPALGGADDIHNLWPESKRTAGWNALVKDALEDRLRDLVCQGQVDLVTAQRDIASNWIEAYKKYFHTDRPLPEVR